MTNRKTTPNRKRLTCIERTLDSTDVRSFDHPNQKEHLLVLARVLGRIMADIYWDAHHAVKQGKPETETAVQLDLFRDTK